MKLQRNRFLYFALTVAAFVVVWFLINYFAVATR